MKKKLLAFTLILALALSASAQADMDAATALVEAYVGSYNRMATDVTGAGYDMTPIDAGSKMVGDSGETIEYISNVTPDSQLTFQFWIDNATSGISRIVISRSKASVQEAFDILFVPMICFGILTGNNLTESELDKLEEVAFEAILAYMNPDVKFLTTDPVFFGTLSIRFSANIDSLSTTLEFNTPLTHEPLI